jgi:3-methyl-2-oxobutanoate hydroxymethyltransferase
MSKITPDAIRDRKGSDHPIAALTAYDYPTARLLDEAGIDLILVGDSLGMTVLGYPDTTQVTLDDMVHHTRAAARGIKSALLVADLPINSYETPEIAVISAGQLVAAGAEAVKLEGGQAYFDRIKAITDAGIPFLGHIGMLPQHIKEEGGYTLKGKTEEQRQFLLAEATAVQAAGGFAVVLELVKPAVAEEISSTISIPTIGIGSGAQCDGQIMVFHDLVGFSPWYVPKHVRATGNVAGEITKAAREYVRGIGLQRGARSQDSGSRSSSS